MIPALTQPFLFEPLPWRVIFGVGALDELPEEVARLGVGRALVLCTPEQREVAEDVARRLGDMAVGVHDGAVMHVPVEVARAARAQAGLLGADCCVAVGGGSTIGLGKAIALEFGTPVVAVPTTYAGSEMTPIWGMTEAGVKRTGTDRRVLPRAVIYDPTLTLSLPPALSGVSGMNAIAHCVEALYARNANPVIALMAEDGIRALARSLPKVVSAPDDLAARTDAQYGAWLAGAALGAVGMAIHHKLCHTLGGALNLPHAQTHSVMLPHAVAYNRLVVPEVMARIAAALGAQDAAGALYDLAMALGAPMSLRALGMRESDIEHITELATAAPYWNPRPITREGMRALLFDAFEGRRPTR